MTKDDLIAEIPDIRTDLAEIRRRFVGGRFDAGKLGDLGFRVKTSRTSGARLEKSYGSRDGILAFCCDVKLAVSRNGELLAVQSENSCSERYPEGWGGATGVDLEERLAGGLDKALGNDLQSAMVLPPSSDIAIALSDLTHYPEVPYPYCERPYDCIASHLIDDSYESSDPQSQQAYAVVMLLRQIDQITFEACHLNLLSFANHFRMREESAVAARAVLALDIPLGDYLAETLTNLGNIYCERLGSYEAALWFFEAAIARNPSLGQPRSNVYVAARRHLAALFSEGRSKEGASIAKRLEKIRGGDSPSLHGYMVLAGLCLESDGDLENASKHYGKALQSDSMCATALAALKRLDEPSSDSEKALSALRGRIKSSLAWDKQWRCCSKEA